jgi:hypothetical protein
MSYLSIVRGFVSTGSTCSSTQLSVGIYGMYILYSVGC